MTVKELVEKCSNEITAYQLCFIRMLGWIPFKYMQKECKEIDINSLINGYGTQEVHNFAIKKKAMIIEIPKPVDVYEKNLHRRKRIYH